MDWLIYFHWQLIREIWLQMQLQSCIHITHWLPITVLICLFVCFSIPIGFAPVGGESAWKKIFCNVIEDLQSHTVIWWCHHSTSAYPDATASEKNKSKLVHFFVCKFLESTDSCKTGNPEKEEPTSNRGLFLKLNCHIFNFYFEICWTLFQWYLKTKKTISL